MINILEKTLTPNEIDKKEEIIKSLKLKKADFIKKYGKDKAMGVMYAIATKTAERVAESIPEEDDDSDVKEIEEAKCSTKKTPQMLQREHLELTGELLSIAAIQERILLPQGWKRTPDPISHDSIQGRGRKKNQMGNKAETSEIVRAILFNKRK